MNSKWKAASAASVVAAMALAGCGGSSGASGGASTVSLVGFSILEQPNKKVIDPRAWTYVGEKGMTARLIEAFKNLGSFGKFEF